MKKIRITEAQLTEMVRKAALRIIEAKREIHYDEDGNEIPEFEDDMNDPKKYVPYDISHSNSESVGKPHGWEALYLKWRRNQVRNDANKMGDAGRDAGDKQISDWVNALKAEYPDPDMRRKVFNQFTSKIDDFRGYKPSAYDKVSDDDPDAVWNKGIRD